MLSMVRHVISALALCSLVSGVSGCVSKPLKQPPVTAPPNAQTELKHARTEFAHHQYRKAIPLLKKLTQEFPKSDVSDQAWTLLGRHYTRAHHPREAYAAYIEVVNANVISPNEGEAILGASKALVKLGRVDEALTLSERGVKAQDLSQHTRLELQKLRYPLLNSMGDHLEALRSLIYLLDHDSSMASKDAMKTHAYEMVNQLNKAELDTVVDDSSFSFTRGFAAYRLATYYVAKKNLSAAADYFNKVIEYSPNSTLATQASNYLRQFEARDQVDPYTIGAILPTDGHYQEVAERTLHGLELGLGIYGGKRSPFRLAIADSEASPEGSKKAIETLITNDHPIAFVGGLLSRSSQALAQRAEELGIPSVILSQKAGVTDVGPHIFRNAITSEMQVKFLVKTAMDKGMRKFAILYPNDAYGVEFANLFWDEVLARGGKITGVQPYDPQETDFRNPIKRLIGTYYLEDREQEYKDRLTKWYQENASAPGRHHPPDDLLPPIVDFDALFVPDSPKALGQIAPMLPYVGVSKIQLLGTNLWDSQEFIRRGQVHVENAIFVDSELSADPRFATSPFAKEFEKVFGQAPGIFETQGYEVGLALRNVISQGQHTRQELTSALANARQVQGVLGPLNINEAREFVRPMVALTVQRGQIIPLANATQKAE